ncbi:SRPBCC domain-containing protein [Streptomyces sp. NPDC087212]|uniref:SRPBCC domain-containing protein n=1 Tax=Streptomyces sp. NPDC087212 TaxID=3365766 RepID=UPI003810064D
MEHEVFVPVVAARLRDALADPARVARAIPGLQQDVGAEPVTGRLKIRVGGHSVTYRGTVRVGARLDGAYLLEGDAVEARGTGAVRIALTVHLRDAEGGATVTFEGTATADGRVTELPAGAVRSAATRLLTRFAEGLAEPADPESPVDPVDPVGPVGPVVSEGDGEVGAPEGDVGPDVEPGAPEGDVEPVVPVAPDEPVPPVPPVPPVLPGASPAGPPAEAAHARRTMIGRSAEEVDHAPPRGRYAPVPAPQTIAPGSSLRWAAPAAAFALASAIVVTRALRKRR